MWELTNPNTGEEYTPDVILMDEKVNKLIVSDIYCYLFFYNICFVHRTYLLLFVSLLSVLFGDRCIWLDVINQFR